MPVYSTQIRVHGCLLQDVDSIVAAELVVLNDIVDYYQ